MIAAAAALVNQSRERLAGKHIVVQCTCTSQTACATMADDYVAQTYR